MMDPKPTPAQKARILTAVVARMYIDPLPPARIYGTRISASDAAIAHELIAANARRLAAALEKYRAAFCPCGYMVPAGAAICTKCGTRPRPA